MDRRSFLQMLIAAGATAATPPAPAAAPSVQPALEVVRLVVRLARGYVCNSSLSSRRPNNRDVVFIHVDPKAELPGGLPYRGFELRQIQLAVGADAQLSFRDRDGTALLTMLESQRFEMPVFPPMILPAGFALSVEIENRHAGPNWAAVAFLGNDIWSRHAF